MDAARLMCRSRDLAQLDQLLTVMEEQSTHAERNVGGYDIEVYRACADIKRSKSDSVCEKRPSRDAAADADAEMAAKRATLERLIRARCDSLAEHLCGSVSNFFGPEKRVEKSPPPPPPVVPEALSMFSWNQRLSLVDRDLTVVRHLICPEREVDRDDDDDDDATTAAAAEAARVAGAGGVSEARTMLGDIHRLIAPGGEEERGGERRSAATREQRQRCARRLQPSAGGADRPPGGDHGARVDAPSRSEPPATFAGPKTFTRLPEESRAAAYEAEDGGGKNTKPERVDPREVLRRQYCSAGGGNNAPTRRQSRANKPAVSKHPQLPTIVEEREAARAPSTTTTTPAPVAPSRDAAAHRMSYPTSPPQRVAVARARFEAEATNHATNQRKATVPTRGPPTPRDTRVCSGEGREATATTDRVQEPSCRLADARKDTASRREDAACEKVDPPSSEAEASVAEESGRPGATEAATDESEGNFSSADEGVEREGATSSDVDVVEEVKEAERSRSTADVARLQRSWLTRAHHEGGENNKGSPGDVTPVRNSSAGGGGGLKFLASVKDKLSCNQELVVLLWLCDLSERLERRSREATNRMRKAVSVGDATLTKLRLLKESLLKVNTPGDSPE